MDILAQNKLKISSRTDWKGARGLESVLSHIEVAERHHSRAKADRDDHLYTDAIYRTNHAYEGILKEAYVVLTGKAAATKTPNEIEEYFLSFNVLRARVVDLLKNYRQNWRNPSTHDYQLFFSEQESFLAIVTVSAFVSILLDQMLEKIAFLEKSEALENASRLAKDEIKDYLTLAPIDKTFRVLLSYCSHYLKNFDEMSKAGRLVATAQMAAFIQKVDPEIQVQSEVAVEAQGNQVVFDLILTINGEQVAVEVRASTRPDFHFDSEAALEQLAARLRIAEMRNGVLFHFPAGADLRPIATTASSIWPMDVNLRSVYGADPDEVDELDVDEPPANLVDERALRRLPPQAGYLER